MITFRSRYSHQVKGGSVDGEVWCSLGRCKGAWTVVRKCDSHQGGAKDIRKVCQLIERCDGHMGLVKGCGETPVSTLRVYLTVTTWGSVSLRTYLYFFCKLLSENPTNHEDSRNSKEIQRFFV